MKKLLNKVKNMVKKHDVSVPEAKPELQQIDNNDTPVQQQEQMEEQQKAVVQDIVTYARYKIIRNRRNQVVDLQFDFANGRMQAILGENPAGRMRSELMPINEKVCDYVQNVIDIGISKHFSFQNNKFGFIHAIIEEDLTDNNYVNIFTIDESMLDKYTTEEILKDKINTILSMFNITILHFNIQEHYVYRDNILTSFFNEDNPDLYTGGNIQSSYELFKSLDEQQQILIENELDKIRAKKKSFASFTVIVRNGIGKEVECRVNILPEEVENMYIIAVQY